MAQGTELVFVNGSDERTTLFIKEELITPEDLYRRLADTIQCDPKELAIACDAPQDKSHLVRCWKVGELSGAKPIPYSLLSNGTDLVFVDGLNESTTLNIKEDTISVEELYQRLADATGRKPKQL